MKKVIGFGDLLLRLNPKGYYRFLQANEFEVNYTGAEANVCVSLSRMGVETQFVTKLPDNQIAECAVSMLNKYGVKTDHIIYGGERIGIFYVEKGASQRPSKVIYDRKYSSFSTTEESDFDWQEIFKDAGHMHITGITPALGEKLPAVCIDACRNAKKAGVTISCDLNYRAKLWSCEQAKAVMEQVLQYVDLLIANEEDSEKVLDIKASGTDVKNGVISRDGYIEVAEKIVMKYGVRNVAITLRESITASDNIWSAMLYRDGHAVFSRKYPVHIVDRVGGGDSFSAALIYAYINGYESQWAIDYAAAASALKHSIESDFNLVTVSEIESLVCGNTTGRVQR